jgi:N-acyl-D-aspartate/D-glutamate deacylase
MDQDRLLRRGPRGDRDRLTPERLAAVTATSAARIFGLHPCKGAIRLGADADLVLLDPDREWTITREEILYRHPRTPYLGRKVTGRVVRTLVRGRTAYAEGAVLGLLGYGELVRRLRSGSIEGHGGEPARWLRAPGSTGGEMST